MILETYLHGLKEFQNTIKFEDFDEEFSYKYYINMLNYLVAHTIRNDYFPNDKLWYDMVYVEIDNYSVFFDWSEEQRERLLGYLEVAYRGLD